MSNKPKLVLDEVLQDTGAKQKGFINVALSPNGSWIRIPVFVVQGDQQGPVLMVDACTHGDEYEGAEAIIQAVQSLDPAKMRGTFIGVPALNFEAFCANSRVSPIDHTNLNRIFPGNSNLFITHRVANAYMQRLVPLADCIITFHGGGTVLHLEPVVGYQPPIDDLGKKTQKLAQAFGTNMIWRMQNLPFDGVSAIEAKKLGIPAILPEIGSHCSRQYDRQKNIDICANGIENVMRELGMLEGSAVTVADQLDIELHYIHTDAGGIHQLIKKANEHVKAGEVLAVVTNVFGDKVSEIVAPFDGVVVGYWSVPVIQAGDWSYLYGKILG